MKHPPKPGLRRLPLHVQAVVDTLTRIGAAMLDTKTGRKLLLIWSIGRRRFSMTISAAVPRGVDAAIYTAKECDRALRACGTMPARGVA